MQDRFEGVVGKGYVGGTTDDDGSREGEGKRDTGRGTSDGVNGVGSETSASPCHVLTREGRWSSNVLFSHVQCPFHTTLGFQRNRGHKHWSDHTPAALQPFTMRPDIVICSRRIQQPASTRGYIKEEDAVRLRRSAFTEESWTFV
ncbi:hypothetical protein PHLCEN_2v10822 [Hermanssonia centrifuga]|uniref:Uncharacterized protein n=1 Tax=Hermanssonia centrifuga TaxID=98765 RepID=A0A2R6NLQ5_9APHY|nr:hypothetical protein PHLCEN_2v10822 [Hermanssonia centrifuga]